MKPFLLACLSATICLAANNSPILVQKPTVNRTHIVFSYAGDLWAVPREGGEAKRLTAGAGVETNRFSRRMGPRSLSPASTTATSMSM